MHIATVARLRSAKRLALVAAALCLVATAADVATAVATSPVAAETERADEHLLAAGGGVTGRLLALPRAPQLSGTRRHVLSLRVGRLTRVAVEVRPAHQPGALPLVVVVHGRRQSPYRAELTQHWDRLAAHGRAVVVYAAGYAGSWNAGRCCGAAARRHVDDVGYLLRLIRTEERRPGVDSARVYLVGFSNGGMLAYRFACLHADELAAVAVVAGVLEAPSCHPSRALPVLDVQGDRDRVVPYAGSRYSRAAGAPTTSVPASLRPWLRLDRRDVRLVRLPRLGHDWPTLRTGGWDGTGQIWHFLSSHGRPLT